LTTRNDQLSIDRIIGAYFARLRPEDAQIGIVWHVEYIDQIIDADNTRHLGGKRFCVISLLLQQFPDRAIIRHAVGSAVGVRDCHKISALVVPGGRVLSRVPK
jgi:hypothetical protein